MSRRAVVNTPAKYVRKPLVLVRDAPKEKLHKLTVCHFDVKVFSLEIEEIAR
jgi:hypothetical protein